MNAKNDFDNEEYEKGYNRARNPSISEDIYNVPIDLVGQSEPYKAGMRAGHDDLLKFGPLEKNMQIIREIPEPTNGHARAANSIASSEETNSSTVSISDDEARLHVIFFLSVLGSYMIMSFYFLTQCFAPRCDLSGYTWLVFFLWLVSIPGMFVWVIVDTLLGIICILIRGNPCSMFRDVSRMFG